MIKQENNSLSRQDIYEIGRIMLITREMEGKIVNNQGDLIFTLDIGTRTVIGLVIEYKNETYEIIASQVVEHEDRAMLDGQIHNVSQVAAKVKEVKEKLEEELGIKLEKVAIAAAGRALKTVNYENVVELDEKRVVSSEDVQALEFSAVQKAQTQLAASNNQEKDIRDYHFVGYSVKEYYLDGIYIGSLEGQRGRKLQVNIIATFLPRIVVDSLLTVVSKAGLGVEYLTLEPIAVANVIIPRDMFNFNLALVDIGAGTSDIALTRGGAMIAYAMVPIAGDEVTEALAEHYLLDYSTGERVKRSLLLEQELVVKSILSQEVIITQEEALKAIETVVQSLASQIGEAILMLNRKPPQAVILVGGGSLTPELVEELTAFLGLEKDRIGIKNYSDIKNIRGSVKGINHAQANTPIGIAISSHKHKNKANFIDVQVNDYKYQLFTFGKATVADALLAAEIDFRKLQGVPGMGLTCNVNGELKIIKGKMGKPGQVFLNDEEVENLETQVYSGDKIIFIPGEEGQDAVGLIADVIPELKQISVRINGEIIELKPIITQNGVEVTRESPLEDGADIKYFKQDTIRDVISYIYHVSPRDLDNSFTFYLLNDELQYIPEGEFLILNDGEPVDLDQPVSPELNLEIIEGISKPITIKNLLNNFRDEIRIVFNGSELSIPVKNKLYCNGKKVEPEYEIKNGDELIYKTRSVSIRYVFDYINYKVTPFFNSFKLTINDKEAHLDDFVKDGDHLRITMTNLKNYNQNSG